jgi:hypothetical protein
MGHCGQVNDDVDIANGCAKRGSVSESTGDEFRAEFGKLSRVARRPDERANRVTAADQMVEDVRSDEPG